jgi:DNA primase
VALIAKSTIQELNDRLDALAVVEDYVRLEKKGGRYWGLCPFHHEKTPSFTVDPEKKMYHCFGCGKGGGIIGFVMEMDKLTYPEALTSLARKTGVEIVYESGGEDTDRDWEAENTRKEALFELYRRTSVTFQHFLREKAEGRAACEYIVSRRISTEMIERFRLGYAPADRGFLYRFLSQKGYSADFLDKSGLFSARYRGMPLFAGRLIFPIADRQGRTVAFGGRALPGTARNGDTTVPKYINSPELETYKKGQTLYAIDLALPAIRQTKTVYLAEGYMDVIALHQAGIENAVAPLGTAFTGDQAKLLKRWAEKAVLVFDSDEAGQNAAYKGIITCRKNGLSCALAVPGRTRSAEFQGITNERAVEEPADLKDPADILQKYGPEILKKSMQCCINDFEYLISRGRSLYNVSVPESKNRALALLFPYLEALDSAMERDDCIGIAADEFRVDREAVVNDYGRWLRRAGGTTGGRAAENSAPEEVPENEQAPRRNEELVLLMTVAVNPVLYPEFRTALRMRDIEDPAAKELFVALEECFVHDESGMDALLSRIGQGALRNYIAGQAATGEFKHNPKRLMEDGIQAVKVKKLQRRQSEISAELRLRERNTGAPDKGEIAELLAEKMSVDAELRRLEER